jgi:predicted alpha-1,2-mannosidase
MMNDKTRVIKVSKLAFLFLFLTVVMGTRFTGASSPIASPYNAVDPFIGTAGGGNTFPGATLPFGMIQWSPDSGIDGFYNYEGKNISGFSLTHLSGAGCPLYADVPVLPWTDDLETSPGESRKAFNLAFNHKDEQAEPGYYSVTLANGVRVELAAGGRAGVARFTFPAGKPARLLVNTGGSADSDVHMAILPPVGREHDGSSVEVVGNNSLTGSVSSGGFCGSPTRYTLYVAATFDERYKSFTTWENASLHIGKRKAVALHTGAWLDFGHQRSVQMKVGLSYVSAKNAADNLKMEVGQSSFEVVRAHARQQWSNLLDRVSVEGGSADQQKIFYTALYHQNLSPNLFSDQNGDYMGFDWKVRSLRGSRQHAQYANFSDWDTYRNTVQLQSLLVPDRVSDMMQSLVNDAVQSGWLPRWPAANDVTYVMGGDSPVVLLSSAYAFGARDFDVKTALKYMVKAGSEPGMGPHGTEERPFLSDYLKLGYIPAEKDAIAASRTLEYASDDFATAQLAKSLGETAIYERFMKQSANWKKLFDPETRWIRPRNSDGSWLAGFSPELSTPKRLNAPVSTDQYGFEEGNTYQYTFMIPFDYPALFKSIGGDAQVTPRLDKFFAKLICWGEPCFNMANEPDFVTPYAYTFAGQSWKTQEVVTRIAKETFRTTADGIPGNDDLGATSGVYFWNALGFYPAVPGIAGVVLGTPMFPKVAVHFSDGRTLVIRGNGTGHFVTSVQLNSKTYTSSWLPLAALGPGTSELNFTLDTQPNKERGVPEVDRPPSFR